MDVQSGGGLTGSGARIMIRGTGSIVAGTDPVVYLDRVRIAADPGHSNRATINSGSSGLGLLGSEPIASGRLEDLSPNEIERVEVLSGPAVTTTYGPDAAKGVVLVTTKRPGVGAAHWAAYGEAGGLSTPSAPTHHTYDAYDAYDAWGHTTGPMPTPTLCPLVDQGAGSCAVDSLTHFSPLTSSATSPIAGGRRDRYRLQVDGAVGLGRYFLSGEWQNETGVLEMPPSDVQLYEAQDGRAPLDGQLRPNSLDRSNVRATLAADLGSHGNLSLFGNAIGGAHRSVDEEALASDVVAGSGSEQINNGWAAFLRPRTLFANDATDRVERYIYGANTTWRLSPGISGQVTAGADRVNAHDETLARPGDNTLVEPEPFENADHLTTEQYTGSTSITGRLVGRSGWSSQSTVGVQYREQKAQETFGAGFTAPGIRFPTGASEFFSQSDNAIQRGAFAEEVVGLADRLFVTGAFGVNGPHALFGKSSFGSPRAEISWATLERGPDALRLRAAYGQSANLSSIQSTPPGVILCIVSGEVGVCPTAPGETTQPERTAEYEAGFDASAWAQRVTLSASVYDRTTSRAAVPRFVPPAAGGGTETVATSPFRNRGVEVALGLTVLRERALAWDIGLVGWVNQNRVVSLGVPPVQFDFVYRDTPGYPLYSIWEPNLTYHDSNGDGIIEADEVSLSAPAYQGSTTPTRALGLHNSLTLLGARLRLAALVDYRGGDRLIDNALAFQNIFGRSRAINDPHASLAEQAQAVASQVGALTYLRPGRRRLFRPAPRALRDAGRVTGHRPGPPDQLGQHLATRAQPLAVDAVWRYRPGDQ